MTQLFALLKHPWLALALCTLAGGSAINAAELQPETVEGFERHVAAVADRSVNATEGSFLGKADSEERRRLLRGGEVLVSPRQGKGDIAVRKGLLHHWIGAVFVPGRTAADALALLRDFESYKHVYAASVEESKTLERDGNFYRAYLRLRKHQIVTVVLNTEYQVEFIPVDDRRWYSRSLSTRIAQVKDAGRPEERELPVGDDSGFLWRIVTLWRAQEADGGVYLECEVIGLTRGVPYGLGWLVRPIIRSFPRESLTETLNDTRNALLGNSGSKPAPRVLSRVSLAGGDAPSSAFEAARP